VTLIRWKFLPVVTEAGGMRAVINVATSYIAELGSAGTARWMPMGLRLARAMAHTNSCVLPTRKVVDLVWAQAAVKLAPIPMPVSNDIATARVITEHSLRIQEVLDADYPKEWRVNLVAGTHKDLVESPSRKPNRVAIYGWHRLDGTPIQPLNGSSHSDSYYDYSHGVRLVRDEVLLGDKLLTFREVCASKELSVLVSDEGPFVIPPYV